MDQLHSSVIVLIIELGEVFRRAMWAVYRIEWEVQSLLVFSLSFIFDFLLN